MKYKPSRHLALSVGLRVAATLCCLAPAAWAEWGKDPLPAEDMAEVSGIEPVCGAKPFGKFETCYTNASKHHDAAFTAAMDPDTFGTDKTPYPAAAAYVAAIKKISPDARAYFWNTEESCPSQPGGKCPACAQAATALEQSICLRQRMEGALYELQSKDPAIARAAAKKLKIPLEPPGKPEKDQHVPEYAKRELSAAFSQMDKVFRHMRLAAIYQNQCQSRSHTLSCGPLMELPDYGQPGSKYSGCMAKSNPACPTSPKLPDPKDRKPPFAYLADPENPADIKFKAALAKAKEEKKSPLPGGGGPKSDADATKSILDKCVGKQYAPKAVPAVCEIIRNTNLVSFDYEVIKELAAPSATSYLKLLRMEAIGRLLQAHRDLLGSNVPVTPEGCAPFKNGIDKFRAKKPIPAGLLAQIPPAEARANAITLNKLAQSAALIKNNPRCNIVCTMGTDCHIELPGCPAGDGGGKYVSPNYAVLEDLKLQMGKLVEKNPYLGVGHPPTDELYENYPKAQEIAAAPGDEGVKAAIRNSSNEISAGIEKTISSFCKDKEEDAVPISVLLHSPQITQAVVANFPEYADLQSCAVKQLDEDQAARDRVATILGGGLCAVASFTPVAVVAGPVCAIGFSAEAGKQWWDSKKQLEWKQRCFKAGGTVCTSEEVQKAFSTYSDAVDTFQLSAAFVALEGFSTFGHLKSFLADMKTARLVPAAEKAATYNELTAELKRIEGIADPAQREQALLKLEEKFNKLKAPSIEPPKPGVTFYSSAKLPKSDLLKVTEIKPNLVEGKPAGKIYTVKAPPASMDNDFQWGNLSKVAEKHPGFASKLGVKYNKAALTLEYPDVEALNANIDKMRKLGDPAAPHVKFWSYTGTGEAPTLEFAERWKNGEMVISSNGKFHFHDTSVHLAGYATLPEEVVKASRARFSTLLDLYHDPKLAARKDMILKIMEREINKVDGATAIIGGDLAHLSGEELQSALSYQFELIGKGNQSINGGYGTYMSDWSAEEKAAADKIFGNAKTPDLSPDDTKKLAQKVLNNL